MDERRLDAIAKVIGAGTNRRRVLAGLLGGTLAGILSRQETEARKKKGRKKKRRGVGAQTHAQQSREACAEFCQNLPQGPRRGECIASCGTGEDGLFTQCQEDPARLCPQTNGTTICCTPPRTVCDAATGACVCPTVVCPPPKTQLNPTTCVCECPPITCDRGQTLNPETCQCEGPICPEQSCCCNCVTFNAAGQEILSFCTTAVTTREACAATCNSLNPRSGHGFGCFAGTGTFSCGRTGDDCARLPDAGFPADCGCQQAGC